MVSLWNGILTKLQNDKLKKCQVHKLVSWKVGKLTKWQVDKMSKWWNASAPKTDQKYFVSFFMTSFQHNWVNFGSSKKSSGKIFHHDQSNNFISAIS
jgi:hypothetical protein